MSKWVSPTPDSPVERAAGTVEAAPSLSDQSTFWSPAHISKVALLIPAHVRIRMVASLIPAYAHISMDALLHTYTSEWSHCDTYTRVHAYYAVYAGANIQKHALRPPSLHCIIPHTHTHTHTHTLTYTPQTRTNHILCSLREETQVR